MYIIILMFSRNKRLFTTATSNKEPLVRIMERIYDNLFVISTTTTLNTVLLFWIAIKNSEIDTRKQSLIVKNNTMPPLGPL